MKRIDKYPPGTPEDFARMESACHKGRVHPLLWVVFGVLIIMGVGVYSDVVGFYDFEELEEIVEGDDDDHEDDHEEDDDERDEEDLHPMERQLMERATDDQDGVAEEIEEDIVEQPLLEGEPARDVLDRQLDDAAPSTD